MLQYEMRKLQQELVFLLQPMIPSAFIEVNNERIASVDKGTHARRTHRPVFRCVIVLDRRQQGLGPKERASADLTV